MWQLEKRVRGAEFRDYAAFNRFLMIAISIELVILLLWSLVYVGNLSLFVTSIIISAAAGATGGIIGFVLGIPKAMTSSNRNDRPVASGGPVSPGRRYENSTALEEISEWLTKIIVGVGLVEFTTIIDKVELLSRRTAPLFRATELPLDALTMIAAALLLINLVLGFSAAYIFTRMYLVSAFFQIDAVNQELLARNVERMSDVGSTSLFNNDATPDDRRSAVELLKVPVGSLRTRDDYLAWAKAHIIFNDYGSAGEALKLALVQWKDPELLSLYARTLAAQRNTIEAREYLEKALKLAKEEYPARLPDVVADQIDGALASGQQSDLDQAKKLLEELPQSSRNSPRLLALDAAMKAQAVGFAREASAGSERLSELSDEVLAPVRALSRIADDRSKRYLGRLLQGLEGRDGLFRALHHVQDNSAIRELLQGETKPSPGA